MKASDIFAEDQDGNALQVGDMVRRRGRTYKICDVHWDVSGDGYYTETVTLSVEDLKSGKRKIFEDSQVLLVNEPEARLVTGGGQPSKGKSKRTGGDDFQIKVWRFDDAPAEFRELSPHGGDEDWLAYIPEALGDEWIGWMEPGSAFGCCEVSSHSVQGGVVKIGAHA